MTKRKKILLIGPVPHSAGGISTVVKTLLSSDPIERYEVYHLRPIGIGETSKNRLHQKGIVDLANGDSSFPKELISVFGGGQITILENFKTLICFREGKRKTIKGNGAKGHSEEITMTLEAFSDGRSPISFRSLVLTTATTFKILESLRTGESQALNYSII